MFLFKEQVYSPEFVWVWFQSLIHQVSVSFEEKDRVLLCGKGFNPLFIRSVFLLGISIELEITNSFCFNPLFIRSVFLFLENQGWHDPDHCEFQSLIHQVSVSFLNFLLYIPLISILSFNPLFIRSVFLFRAEELNDLNKKILFQSLIHQVSVSFR